MTVHTAAHLEESGVRDGQAHYPRVQEAAGGPPQNETSFDVIARAAALTNGASLPYACLTKWQCPVACLLAYRNFYLYESEFRKMQK